MAYRDYGQGYRGGPNDRDYEENFSERDRDARSSRERDDLWERDRDRGEFSRGRGNDWSERDRGFSRGRGSEWSEREQQSRSRGGYDANRGMSNRGFDQEDRYQGEFGRRYSGRQSNVDWDDRNSRMSEFRTRGGQRGDLSARDFESAEDFDYAGEEHFRSPGQYMQQRGDYGFSRGQYGRGEQRSRGFGFGESNRYWGSGSSGYGPSTGYGYGTAGSYLGGPDTMRSRESYSERTYVGRGPRGYKRSDDRIREEINERLTQHPDIDASDVDVRVLNCEVVLSGVVEDRKAKRLAEDIAEEVWGIDDVKNELKVRRGFLAALTGEQADDREVARTATREGTGTSTRAKIGQTGSTPGMSASSTPTPGSST
jgi:hypothetical protein